MKKPEGFDSAQAIESGVSKQLPAGNYVCTIINAKTQTSRSGKEMLVIALDIAEGEFKGYWRDRFETSRKYNSEAKYPCVYRQLTEGNHMGYFKGMLKAIEESNTAYKWNWDEETLKNRKVGVQFGEEEFLGRDGDILTSCKPMYICSVKSLKDKPVLAPKKLNRSGATAPPAPSEGFTDLNMEEISEDDLPF